MAGITIECVGEDGLRLDRERGETSETAYLAGDEKASLDGAFLAEISAAESGEPRLRLSNAARNLAIDIYSVSNGSAVRSRTLNPEHSRQFWLAKGERLLLIPVPAAKA